MKRVINPLHSHFRNVMLFVSSLTGLGTRSETFNILVLKCIGCVDPIE